jgi:LmbE family N-acetylglucosaminyl deacetylase
MARLMAIYAHPDDEAFSVGGSLARAVAGGHAAAVVCATRGEKGEISDPALATPETLGQVREQELRRACAVLGVRDVSFLDYIDGELDQAPHDEAVGRLVGHLHRFRPDVVVTFAANGGYGHRDHIAIHKLTLAAVEAAARPSAQQPHRVRKVYFSAFPREAMARWRQTAQQNGDAFRPGGDTATIPLEEMGTPEAEITTIVMLDDVEIERKQRALLCHATQFRADNPIMRADPEVLRAFAGREHFTLAAPPLSDKAYPTPEDDLLAGL